VQVQMNEQTCCVPRAQVGQPAPEITATAVVDGQFEQVRLSSLRGKNVVLFFWPLDFTFVCPTEIAAFSDAATKFAERNTVLLGVSVDSQFTHLAWQKTPRTEGGLGKVAFPMLADLTKEISRNYGVLNDGGIALRGLFLIDSQGVVRHMLVNDLPLGRSVDEALRMVDALAHFERHGEVCPANWKPGAKGMKTDPQGSKTFFQEWGRA
jgi:alkyl hydroperoxide reductase subunit AhpC